jgi:hypothetical protein
MDRARSHAEKHAEGVEKAFDGLQGPLADFGCGEGIFSGRPGYVGLDREAGSAAMIRADPLLALEEIDRVLRPGGRAYVKNRWYKTAGRRNAPSSLLARVLHQASFWAHGWAHGGTSLSVRANSDGTNAICPGCFRRFFAGRGYRVDFPATHVAVLTKPS